MIPLCNRRYCDSHPGALSRELKNTINRMKTQVRVATTTSDGTNDLRTCIRVKWENEWTGYLSAQSFTDSEGGNSSMSCKKVLAKCCDTGPSWFFQLCREQSLGQNNLVSGSSCHPRAMVDTASGCWPFSQWSKGFVFPFTLFSCHHPSPRKEAKTCLCLLNDCLLGLTTTSPFIYSSWNSTACEPDKHQAGCWFLGWKRAPHRTQIFT